MNKYKISRKETVTVVANSLEEASAFGTHLFTRGYRDVDDVSSDFGYSTRPETTGMIIDQVEDNGDQHA